MPINLHPTPMVPSKHPSITGAFLILGLMSVQPCLSPTLVLQSRKAEIQVLTDAEIRTVIQY